MKLIILLWRKYNGRIFKNNPSKNQETSEIVRNSRKLEQETVWTKEEVQTRETSKTCWNAPETSSRFKAWRTGKDGCWWWGRLNGKC